MNVVRPKVPNFFEHLWLLWGLRLRIGINRGSKLRAVLSVLAFLASSAPAFVLMLMFFSFMRLPVVRESDVWPAFILRLVCFVTTATWVAWPVLSAGVDDHSELSRYAAYPISSLRLMVASTIASLFEPRALVFYAPVVGAAIGYYPLFRLHHPTVVLFDFAAWVFFNAALSRVGLHAVLGVLRAKRSAEVIGTGFVVSLVVASFIPPVDTRWLTDLQTAGVAAVPDRVLEDAALALGRFPTGWFAQGFTEAAQGDYAGALGEGIDQLILALVALTVAWGLLIDFHRQAGRGGPVSSRSRDANPFATSTSVFTTLVAREALDLWNNPRARLLMAVPFVLGILLKLLSGRALFEFFVGRSADAWILAGLAVYGALVMTSTFSQNAFAYDGHGMAVFLAAPQRLGQILRAKNLVHAVAGVLLASAATLFYVTYFRHGSLLDVALSLTAVMGLVPVLLTAGNFLSVFFPVKFHADLKRRDRLPLVASMIGLSAAGLGFAPLASQLEAVGKAGPTLETLGVVAGAAVLAAGLYALTLPVAMRLLEARRELVLRAVTRD